MGSSATCHLASELYTRDCVFILAEVFKIMTCHDSIPEMEAARVDAFSTATNIKISATEFAVY